MRSCIGIGEIRRVCIAHAYIVIRVGDAHLTLPF